MSVQRVGLRHHDLSEISLTAPLFFNNERPARPSRETWMFTLNSIQDWSERVLHATNYMTPLRKWLTSIFNCWIIHCDAVVSTAFSERNVAGPFSTVHAHGARSGPNRTPAPMWIFLSGTVCADFFVLPDSSSFWSHFSAANYKTTKFSFQILCRCAELPAKRMDSARGSARVLASSCSQHSRRAAHSSRRSKRGDYSAI